VRQFYTQVHWLAALPVHCVWVTHPGNKQTKQNREMCSLLDLTPILMLVAAHTSANTAFEEWSSLSMLHLPWMRFVYFSVFFTYIFYFFFFFPHNTVVLWLTKLQLY